MPLSKNNWWSQKQLQSGLQLHMQLILAANVDLDQNENEKYTYIIIFNGIPK
jgi:hypothetical protein